MATGEGDLPLGAMPKGQTAQKVTGAPVAQADLVPTPMVSPCGNNTSRVISPPKAVVASNVQGLLCEAVLGTITGRVIEACFPRGVPPQTRTVDIERAPGGVSYTPQLSGGAAPPVARGTPVGRPIVTPV